MSQNKSNPFALTTTSLTVCYQDQPVLWDVSLEVPQGKLVAIIGPNGAGKSTFMKACLNLIKPLYGEAQFLGMPFEKARLNIAYVPQKENVDWDFPINVRDLVTMGRFGSLGWLESLGDKDEAIIDEAIKMVGLEDYEKRQIHQLSGGQQQRAFLARALAQKADLYFMDEPFAAVDMATEEQLIRVMQNLCQRGSTVFVIHHDLKSVQEHFDWVIVLSKKLIANGAVSECLTPATLQRAYEKPVDHLLGID